MQFSDDPLALHKLICHYDWDAVLKHVEVYPGYATAKDGDGRLPLHYAAFREAPPKVMKKLVRIYPKSINAKNKWGILPLHVYLRYCEDQTLEVFKLLQRKKSVRAANNQGQLPLHWACDNQHTKLEVLQRLLDDFPEAAVAVDLFGRTPLHFACRRWTSEQSELFTELIKRNPKAANIANKRGKYPLHLACDNEDFSIGMIKSIVNANPDAWNIRDNDGNIPKTRHWFMELLELEKNFDSRMQEMTFLAAGAALESNRFKRRAEDQEPGAEARNEWLRKEIDVLKQQLDEKDEIVLKCQAKVQTMIKSLIAVTLVGLYFLGRQI